MQQPERTRLAPSNPGTHLPHRRVVAVYERHGRENFGLRGRRGEPARVRRCGGQWLLTHHVLPRPYGKFREGSVSEIRSADVHDVHVRSADQLLGRGSRMIDHQPFRRAGSLLKG